MDLSLLEGAGGIKSSVSDLSLFVQANLTEDRPITATLQKSHLPIVIGNTNRYFGWHEDKLLDKSILWHNGGTAGFTSYLALNKELRAGIVLDPTGKGILEATMRRIIENDYDDDDRESDIDARLPFSI